MISFILNETLVETHWKGEVNLLEFIRKNQDLKGSKLTCGEGECGSCTVLVGERDVSGMNYKSMTSCIMPLHNARNKHIVTIEGLKTSNISPVMEMLIESNGTQCGFCTPGFVVSLTGGFLARADITPEALISSIDGNICRCTGYKSIIRAISNLAAHKLPEKWASRLEWLVDNHFIPAYFKTIEGRLGKLNRKYKQFKLDSSQKYVGGGSDMYVQQPFEIKSKELIPLFDERALKFIKSVGDTCEIGASTTMEDLNQSPEFQNIFPDCKAWFKRISSTQIRNMSTIGGNLVNASPIGDMTILFLGLNSLITLVKGEHQRRIQLKEFYLEYKKLDLREGEVLKSVQFEIPSQECVFNFEKVSKRTHFDIASVNTACRYELDGRDRIKNFHLALGGVAPVPKYCSKTADFLMGKSLNIQMIREAGKTLQSEISPISDTRGSAGYKRLLARQLFLAHFKASFSEKALLSTYA